MDFDKESVPAAFPSISHCGDSFLKGGSEGLGSLCRGSWQRSCLREGRVCRTLPGSETAKRARNRTNRGNRCNHIG